jgi:GAF domain-containing protein
MRRVRNTSTAGSSREPQQREIAQLRAQQAATAGILRAISHSPTEVGPVFDIIVANAARLCEANFAFVMLYQKDRLWLAARTSCTSGFAEYLEKGIALDRQTSSGRAALARRTTQVPDFLADPEVLVTPAHRTESVRTILAVPMLRDDALLGVITLWRHEVRPFTDEQINLLEIFADQAVIAIENVRLLQELNARNGQLAEALEHQTATSEVLKVISRSSFELGPVLQTLIEYATKLCDADQGFIFRRADDGYRLAVGHRAPPEFTQWRLAAPIRFGERGSVVGRAASEGHIIQIADAQLDSEWLEAHRDAAGTRDVHTMLGVPMLREGVPIGVFAMWRTVVRPFTEKQIELITTFADQAVIAIEDVRLFQELEAKNSGLTEALEQQTATAEILRVISSSPTGLQSVLDAVVERAARLCGSDDAIIRFADGEGLRRVAHFGSLTEPANTDMHPIQFKGVGSRAFLERRAIHVDDIVEEFRRGNYRDGRPLQEPIGYRTVLAVPLLRKEEAIGVILIRRLVVQPFTDKQIELLQTFADEVVIAIENVRLFQTLEARNRELTEALKQQTATAEILRVISSSLTDALPVFETIARNAVTLCGSLFANVFRFDGELLHYVTSHNAGPSFAELLQAKYPMRPDSSQVSGRVILSRSVVTMEDAHADPDYDQRFPSARGWRRMLGVPMLREGKPVGVIVVAWAEPGPVPTVQEELLRTFADQAVIAVENARLFDEIQEKSRQLELANTYKSRFLAAASHDLRQPLHALNLFAAQIRTAIEPAERSRLVVQIDAAIGAMNELFDALLDMSKLDAGVLEPSLSEFPAAHLLERMKTTFAEAAHEKGLRLGVVPTRAWIRSDFILLERILLNFVSNAVRYTTKGGVVVGCRRRAGRLHFEVWDSGPGIPEDQKESIFGEFYQIAARATAARGGLGLGLAIVDRLGRLLDHPVEVASRLGRGSRFSVSVPRVAEHAVPREPSDSLARIADTVSGKLVVVIDDDALVLSAMEGILRSWGCNTVTAPTEGAALAVVRQLDRQPDLIISDYRLAEGRTGIDAIEGLRRALGSAVPAFLMSGDTAPDRLRDATRGNYALLHKPVAPMTLRAMVNRYLKAATSPHSRAGSPMPPPR